MKHCALLSDRAVLVVAGDEARDFLQGLITKDMRNVTHERPAFATLLSPQGRFLFEFFVTEREGGFRLETDKARLPDLMKRLLMYRLRAKVEIKEHSCSVFAGWGGDAPASDHAYIDPRLPELGWRMALPSDAARPFTGMTEGAYDAHRISLGVPEGAKDLTYDRSILLEYGYDELHAVDFDKGCYVGQEVTARSKHRASLRKFIHLLKAEASLPAKGMLVQAGGRDVGIITSTHENQGLGYLNHEEVLRAARENIPLLAGDVAVTANLPVWCKTELAGRSA